MEQRIDEFLGYLQLLKKRRRLFLSVALLVTTALIAYSYTIPRDYRADSTVFIESNILNHLTKGLAVTPDIGESVRVLKFALLSRDNIRRTLLEIDPQLQDEARLQQQVESLQKQTEITTNGNDLFKVSIVDPDPVFAQTYINTLIDSYIAQSLSGKRAATAGASRFLDGQLEQFRSKLEQAEDAIIAFRREQGGLLALDEEALLAESAEYRRQIEEVELQLEGLRTARSQLQNDLDSFSEPGVAGTRPEATPAVELQERLQTLLLSYTENYPEVIKLRRELDALQGRGGIPDAAGSAAGALGENPFMAGTRQELAETNAKIRTLQGRQVSLEQFRQQRESELEKLPEISKKLASLTQERDSYRKIYEEMLLRLSQSEVSRQLELGEQASNFRVVDAALLPIEPISPDMTRMILMAIAAGLGCGFGAIVLRENLDGTVKNAGELRELGVEILAMVPGIVNPALVKRQARQDLLIYTVAGLYFTAILGLLVFETLTRMGIRIS